MNKDTSNNVVTTKNDISNNTLHKKRKKRCNLIECRKKLKLTDWTCCCEFTFCYLHRLPEKHFCIKDITKRSKERYSKNVILGGGEISKICKI